MSAPQTMSPDDMESLLRWVERREPAYADVLREHHAALEQEIASAEARGFERAKAQAADIAKKYADERQAESVATVDDYDRHGLGARAEECREVERSIRAMKDGQ